MINPSVYVQKLEEIYYPKNPPFHPNQLYPEYLYNELSREKNSVYDSIRNLLYQMGLDTENWNTKYWNPFKNFIKPNNLVLLKPNLVLDNLKFQDCITTHPSVIRPIIDYVNIALKGKGEIIVGDAPLQSCNFNELIGFNGLKKTINYLKSKQVNITIADFRLEKLSRKRNKFIKIERIKGDPKGYTVINLSKESALDEISFNYDYNKFRVVNYDPKAMQYAHNQLDHKYLIANSVLQADVIINLPKIKTHKKTGITACLKNSIGINGHKDWLPHHRKGSVLENGDEYLNRNIIKKILVQVNELDDLLLIRNFRLHYLFNFLFRITKSILRSFIYFFCKDKFLSGSWYGNDTLWRVIADLNRIMLFANKKGELSLNPQRKLLYICDGLVCGESEGPLNPKPSKAGILIGGYDPLIIDLAITELMNFDYSKIPQIFELLHLKGQKISNSNVENLIIKSNNDKWNNKKINEIENSLTIEPSKGWKGHIEKNYNSLKKDFERNKLLLK